MLTSIRSLMAATVLGSALLAAPAFAQDSDLSIAGNATVASEYRFRGVDLSGGDIAIQGGVTVSHSSGFYVGTWGSSLDEDTVGYGHTELDLYGGWAGDLTDGQGTITQEIVLQGVNLRTAFGLETGAGDGAIIARMLADQKLWVDAA